MSLVEQLRGKLAVLKDQREKLKLRIDGNARQMCQGLNTLLVPAEEIEVPLLDEQWDELKIAWSELQIVNSNINRLVKELR